MALKKSELYSSLWKSCDELRGGMDASQYKDYVLVLMFVKYVSDKYAGDRDALIDIPAGGGFADMVAAKGDKEIGDRLNKIIGKLADANDSLKGAINVADFNDEDKLGKGKEMVDRLTTLVSIFEGLDFGRNRADGDDLLGDAYEYLMRHFATESGKSKGQFYTPAEVSRVMSMVIELGRATSGAQTIYDPTCGSGSLLLKAHDEAKNLTGRDLTIYGQEMDNATSAMARMNMVLHGCPTAEIWQANSLSSPHWVNDDGSLKTFDFVVANPPFSNKNWTSGLNAAHDPYDRFEYGTPPDKNGDYAFLLHMLKSMKSTGKAAVILPHGVLFRGGAEASIRTRLIKQGFIKGIIGLPANLFYGTGIPACIIVMDKQHAAARKGIFMIDASKGFLKDGNKNRLRAQDIHKIVDAFTRLAELPKYSRMVPLSEIEGNDFNLNLPRYIDSTEPEDLQDIEAHLKGGIPNRDIDALAAYWKVFPSVRKELFADADRPGYSQLKVEASAIKAAIFENAEFTAFNQLVTKQFEAWQRPSKPSVEGIQIGDRPKTLIAELSERLLADFQAVPLIDAYDVYQHLMDYWETTMQDDVYLLVAEGWAVANTVRQLIPSKDKNNKPTYNEPHDFVFNKVRYKADIIPPALIIANYFPSELAAIEALEAQAAAYAQQLDELREEHGGEDGLLAEVVEDGKIAKGSVAARLKEIKRDKDLADERAQLEAYQALLEQEFDASRKAKDARKALDEKVFAQYPELSEDEVKMLVVEDKWLATLAAAVQGELDRVSQALTGRIRQLADRYATPLPQLAKEVEALSARVGEHLKKMGFAWN
ncbi:MAG: type I restriction-modification system subunit M [Humidesulfovibrio sp.]|uniref:type I restriction-modification system subunit M n=1 Tax=Humidesulfovibrio sp. TaxID=2910988 RepID=UPI0027F6D166|nr:type I restriction-modification system subunit M [Humidesulfovibrio sp.]MDQ7835339.1 type I restriction-modification system subunit M [Humidesulfovibrio sp.]